MTRRARLALGLIVGLAVLSVPQTVAAHADLSTTEPAANAVLETAPDEIVLTFTEGVDIGGDAIRLVDAQGSSIALAPIEQPTGDTVIARPLDELGQGTFVVAWAAVSADSHPIRGAFVFSVGAPSNVASEVVTGILDDSGSTSPAERVLGVGRFMSYLGVAAMLGVLALVVAVTPSRLGAPRTGTVVHVAGLVGVAGTALMISAQAAEIGTSAADWGAVAATRSGQWWVVRLMAVAGATALVRWRHLLARRPVQIGATVAGVGLLAVVAAGGHAVSGRAIPLGFAATVVHLAAMSAWVGGLCVLALVVPRDEVWTTAKRFSPIALGAVVALVASGSVNAWRQVAATDAIAGSSYGRWLLIKLQIVLVVLAIAGLTRLLLRRHAHDPAAPSAGRPAAPRTTSRSTRKSATNSTGPEPDGNREVRSHVWFEVIGIVAVVAATAGLTGATPPRATSAIADTPADATVTVERDGYTMRMDVIPAVAGDVTVHVYVTPVDATLPPPDEITASIELAERGVGPVEVPLEPVVPGHVTSSSANIPLAGDWTVSITARFGEFDQVIFTGGITIAGP